MNKTRLVAGLFILAISALACCNSSRKGLNHVKEIIHPVSGTLDGPLEDISLPDNVLEALEKDTLPREPSSRYDESTHTLSLACCVMGGTGVHVEKLYQLHIGDDNSAAMEFKVEPFDVQKVLCGRLGYAIDGEDITFYDGIRKIATVTNTVTGMGGFDSEHPVWIGEQLKYNLGSETPRIFFSPGLKFTTGLVLIYDDMPELSADLCIAEDGTWTIGAIRN